MYKIGSATRPDEYETIWALDIDYHQPDDNDKYPLIEHGAQIRVHGDSLSACMIKAHIICEAMNGEGVPLIEVLTQLLEHARVIEKDLEDRKDEVDAESDS